MARPIVTWAWLAGFTDGDGCISILSPTDKRGSIVRISWAQKEEDSLLLQQIAKFIARELKKSNKEINRTSVVYKGHDYPQAGLYYGAQEDVRVILENLSPLLVLKHEKAREGLAELGRKKKIRESKGWIAPPTSNCNKTHCVRGHRLSGKNLYLTSRGRRECKTCLSRRSREASKKQSERMKTYR